jgi:NADPH-dependent 2,4-dienoyl-CoA reductase/sulfur reductase-like enzyme
MIESFDLAIIGAGPAGLEAAISASSSGVKTVIIDQAPQAGGQYYKPLPGAFNSKNKTHTEVDGEVLTEQVNQLPVTRYFDTLTWGIFKRETVDGYLVTLAGPVAPRQLYARTLILATGAYDTPVAFPGWTLPGVSTCGASLLMLKNQRVAPFKRVLLTGTGPLLLSAAAHMIDAGIEVVSICESNQIGLKSLVYAPTMLKEWKRIEEGAGYMRKIMGAGVPYKIGWSITEAKGKEQVEAAVIARLDREGRPVPGTEKSLDVDAVISGYSLIPNTGLARMIGCKFEYQSQKGGWVPVRDVTLQTDIIGIYMVGDCAGIGGAEASRLEGRIAGAAVAFKLGLISKKRVEEINDQMKTKLSQQRKFGRMLGEIFSPKFGLVSLAKDDTLVCRCEEITLGEVKTAVAQGARSIGEVKMITRSGMGNCQGRMCEHSVSAALIQELANEQITHQQVGSYSVRPPLHPLPIGFFEHTEFE